MKWHNRGPMRWLALAIAGLMALAWASFGIARADVARAATGDQACYKVENPSGTVVINQNGLAMTLQIGTFGDVADPNKDNAVTSVQLDPLSVVTTGTITIKGGPDSTTYTFGATPPLHAPSVGSNEKWPTISYLEVCWDKPTHGRVEVTKIVTGEGAPTDEVFTVSLTAPGASAIVRDVKAGEVAIFEGLEPGVYTLTENDPGSDWSVAYSPSSTVTVVAGLTSTATVTNAYALGRVEVTKVVSGTGAPDREFTVSLTPAGGTAISKLVTAGGTVVFDGLTPGEYALSEADLGDGWSVAYSPSSTVTVVAGQTSEATVTNTYSPAPLTGRVEVTKVVAGDAVANQAFEISLTPAGGSALTKTITGPGMVSFENLTPGVYTVSESYPGSGWTIAYSTPTVTVVAGQTSTATVTNTYVQQLAPPGLGSVIVTKVVSGDPPPTTYYIGLVGLTPGTAERWLAVTGGGEVTFSAMPVGTYTVVERDPGTHYAVTISPTTVDVTNGGVARATVTNAYTEVAPAVGTLPKSGGSATPVIAMVAVTLLVGGTALTAVGHRRRVG